MELAFKPLKLLLMCFRGGGVPFSNNHTQTDTKAKMGFFLYFSLISSCFILQLFRWSLFKFGRYL